MNANRKTLFRYTLIIGVCIISLQGCAVFKPFGIGGDDGGNGQDVTPLFVEGQSDLNGQPTNQAGAQQGQQQTSRPQSQPGSSGLVTQRVGDQRPATAQISEMRFELKKLQAEISHLNTEITNLNNRSEMWRDPQGVYNKKIVLTNGTIFHGNVSYQDERFVKVETLIGTLVLQRNSISRILENTLDYAPNDLTERNTGPLSNNPRAMKETSGAYANAQTGMRRANVVLNGTIKERKDNSGNTIFTGIMKNTGSRRADFVKINFVIRKDWSGNTQTFTTFVNGAQFSYGSGVTTDTSLPMSAIGTFELYIPKSIGPFIGYSYSIDWEEYE